MLISVVIHLSVKKNSICLNPSGRDTQAWLLNRVRTIDRAFVKEIHDSSAIRPYTTSGLLTSFGKPLLEGTEVAAGKSLLIRLTAMTEQMSTILKSGLPHPGDLIVIQSIPLEVNQVMCDNTQHAWAGGTTYRGLIQDAIQTNSQQFTLAFVTPTSFRNQGTDTPLPVPRLLARSWGQKWNTFSPLEFHIDEKWTDFVEECVRVSRLTDVNTERWSFANSGHGTAVGFTGEVGLVLLPPHLCPNWSAYWPGAKQMLSCLCSYSFYCGTGHSTTFGMGQTKLVAKSSIYQEAGTSEK